MSGTRREMDQLGGMEIGAESTIRFYSKRDIAMTLPSRQGNLYIYGALAQSGEWPLEVCNRATETGHVLDVVYRCESKEEREVQRRRLALFESTVKTDSGHKVLSQMLAGNYLNVNRNDLLNVFEGCKIIADFDDRIKKGDNTPLVNGSVSEAATRLYRRAINKITEEGVQLPLNLDFEDK